MNREATLEGAVERIKQLVLTEAERILRDAAQRVSAAEADLGELERDIRRRVLTLGGSILEEALAVGGTGYRGATLRCGCGGRQKYVENRPKTLTTLLQQVTPGRFTVRTVTPAGCHSTRDGTSSIPGSALRCENRSHGWKPSYHLPVASSSSNSWST